MKKRVYETTSELCNQLQEAEDAKLHQVEQMFKSLKSLTKKTSKIYQSLLNNVKFEDLMKTPDIPLTHNNEIFEFTPQKGGIRFKCPALDDRLDTLKRIRERGTFRKLNNDQILYLTDPITLTEKSH